MQKLKTLEEVSKERDIPIKTLKRWTTEGMKSVKAGPIKFYDEWVDEHIENMARERAEALNKKEPNKKVVSLKYQPLRKIVGNKVH